MYTLGFADPSNSATYLGVEFNPGDGVHYGWVSLTDTLTPANGSHVTNQTVTITGFAYETTSDPGVTFDAGDGITTQAAVPEPASLLQLAMGAVGLAALPAVRRRRKLTCGTN